MNKEEYLLSLCDSIYKVERDAQAERKRELFNDTFFPELLIGRLDKVRIEIRKENVAHNEPHLHVTHTDVIDASISLKSFEVLAGKIDKKSYKHLLRVIFPNKDHLLRIWEELNEKDNSIGAEKLINSLSF